MSLETMFAALKMDDVSRVVEAVKNDGVEKSGLAANVAVLVARCDSADEAEALAALKTAKQLAIECPHAQAFTMACLSACTSSLCPWLVLCSATACFSRERALWGLRLIESFYFRPIPLGESSPHEN